MKKKRRYSFLHKYQNVYLYLTILVISGFFVGIFLSKYIDSTDINELSQYLTVVNEYVDGQSAFIQQLFMGILFILFVFLLGTSIIGIPLISFITFTKGLQIGFSCALFVCSYQLKGLLGILITLLPQVLFDLAAAYFMSASAIQLSMYLLYSSSNHERLDFKKLTNSVLNDLCVCFVIVLIGAWVKTTLVIQLIKLFNLM